MTIAVTTAPVAPPINPAIPITLALTGSMPRPGTIWLAAQAKAPPSVAPITSEGEKMPPDPPDPSVSEVAASFNTKINTSNAGTVSRLLSTSCTVA